MFQRSRAAAVLGAVALTAAAVVSVAAPANAATHDGKVSFCHATGSAKNPSVSLKIGAAAINAWSYTNGTHVNDLGSAAAAAAGTTATAGVDPSLIPSQCLPTPDDPSAPANTSGGSTDGTGTGTGTAPVGDPSSVVGGTTGTTGSGSTSGTATGTGSTGTTTSGSTGGTTSGTGSTSGGTTDTTTTPSAGVGTGSTTPGACTIVWTSATTSVNLCTAY